LLVFGLVGTRAPGARFEARVEARADHGPHFSGGGWWGPPEGPLEGGAGAGAPKETLLGRPRFLARECPTAHEGSYIMCEAITTIAR
jgi:hypothetical protein